MNYLQFILQLEFFTSFFSNVFNLLMTIILILLGMILGVFVQRYILRPKNQLLYLRERDGRGHEMDMKDEDAISFVTKTDPELRFFKHGRAYEFTRRGRSFTRFFGKEGTAYTWVLQGFTKKPTKFQEIKEYIQIPSANPGKLETQEITRQIPIEWEEQKIECQFHSLEDAVKFRWGDDYERTPEEMKEKLRQDKLLVTVNLEPGLTPEGYQIITESTVNTKADEDAASLIAEELKQANKRDWIELIITLVAGMGIITVLFVALGKLNI